MKLRVFACVVLLSSAFLVYGREAWAATCDSGPVHASFPSEFKLEERGQPDSGVACVARRGSSTLTLIVLVPQGGKEFDVAKVSSYLTTVLRVPLQERPYAHPHPFWSRWLYLVAGHFEPRAWVSPDGKQGSLVQATANVAIALVFQTDGTEPLPDLLRGVDIRIDHGFSHYVGLTAALLLVVGWLAALAVSRSREAILVQFDVARAAGLDTVVAVLGLFSIGVAILYFNEAGFFSWILSACVLLPTFIAARHGLKRHAAKPTLRAASAPPDKVVVTSATRTQTQTFYEVPVSESRTAIWTAWRPFAQHCRACGLRYVVCVASRAERTAGQGSLVAAHQGLSNDERMRAIGEAMESAPKPANGCPRCGNAAHVDPDARKALWKRVWWSLLGPVATVTVAVGGVALMAHFSGSNRTGDKATATILGSEEFANVAFLVVVALLCASAAALRLGRRGHLHLYGCSHDGLFFENMNPLGDFERTCPYCDAPLANSADIRVAE